jgi:Family of unknown function (DUF6325)
MSTSVRPDTNELGGVGPVDEMGPIDFYCFEFPPQQTPGNGFKMLVQLVDRGIIRVLDLAFVRKDADGSVRRVTLAELGPDAAVFEGASSGLLDEEDFAQAGEMIAPGHAAGLLVIENHWAAPLATTLRRQGAQLVAAERLPVQAILAALDAAEARG